MQVLVVVIDDNGNSETFKLERDGESRGRNYDIYSAKERVNPLTGRPTLFSKTHVMKGFKAKGKS